MLHQQKNQATNQENKSTYYQALIEELRWGFDYQIVLKVISGDVNSITGKPDAIILCQLALAHGHEQALKRLYDKETVQSIKWIKNSDLTYMESCDFLAHFTGLALKNAIEQNHVKNIQSIEKYFSILLKERNIILRESIESHCFLLRHFDENKKSDFKPARI
jgi:hypothetical protein